MSWRGGDRVISEKHNGRPDKRPVTLEELLVSSLAQTDVLTKLLIEKGLITLEEFVQKISEERATYQNLFTDQSKT